MDQSTTSHNQVPASLFMAMAKCYYGGGPRLADLAEETAELVESGRGPMVALDNQMFSRLCAAFFGDGHRRGDPMPTRDTVEEHADPPDEGIVAFVPAGDFVPEGTMKEDLGPYYADQPARPTQG